VNGQEPGFEDHSVTIAAGGSRVWTTMGTMIKIYSATAEFRLKINDGARLTMKTGRMVEMPPGLTFDRLEFKNDGASDLTVDFAIGFGRVSDDPVLTGEIESEFKPYASVTPETDVSITAASTVQVIAADSTRRAVLVGNLEGNAQTMRIGDSTAAAAKGQEIKPGETIELRTTAALYAYNPGGSAESLSVVVLA
jgi:hypothetical protein